jgi:hypothetical protein
MKTRKQRTDRLYSPTFCLKAGEMVGARARRRPGFARKRRAALGPSIRRPRSSAVAGDFDADTAAVSAATTRAAVVARIVDAGEPNGARNTREATALDEPGLGRRRGALAEVDAALTAAAHRFWTREIHAVRTEPAGNAGYRTVIGRPAFTDREQLLARVPGSRIGRGGGPGWIRRTARAKKRRNPYRCKHRDEISDLQHALLPSSVFVRRRRSETSRRSRSTVSVLPISMTWSHTRCVYGARGEAHDVTCDDS